MLVFNLVETTDSNVSYGMLLIEDGSAEMQTIQETIDNIKNEYNAAYTDWNIQDVINRLPKHWNASLHEPSPRIVV